MKADDKIYIIPNSFSQTNEIVKRVKRKYKTVNIGTLKGLKLAEKLHTSGEWKIIASSIDVVQFMSV